MRMRASVCVSLPGLHPPCVTADCAALAMTPMRELRWHVAWPHPTWILGRNLWVSVLRLHYVTLVWRADQQVMDLCPCLEGCGFESRGRQSSRISVTPLNEALNPISFRHAGSVESKGGYYRPTWKIKCNRLSNFNDGFVSTLSSTVVLYQE